MPPQILSVACMKGGVGKSTTALNLAAQFATDLGHPRNVLLVDTDEQRTVSWLAERIDKAGRLPFTYATEFDPENLAQLSRLPFDVIVCDTPGHHHAPVMLDAVIQASHYIVVPVEPTPASVRAMYQTVSERIVPQNKPYRVLLSRMDVRWGKERNTQWRQQISDLGMPLFDTVVRSYTVHGDAQAEARILDPEAGERIERKAAGDFKAVSVEVLADLAGRARGAHRR